MESTFNTTELLQDKDLTIAQLRSILSQQEQSNAELRQQLDNQRTYIETLSAELEDAKRSVTVLTKQAEKSDFDRLLDGLLKAEVEQRVIRMTESPDFFDMIDIAVEQACADRLERCDIDCEQAVEQAIEECLNHARISFR